MFIFTIRIGFNADSDPALDPAFLINVDPEQIRIQDFEDQK
jgi:hypothetical protein